MRFPIGIFQHESVGVWYIFPVREDPTRPQVNHRQPEQSFDWIEIAANPGGGQAARCEGRLSKLPVPEGDEGWPGRNSG